MKINKINYEQFALDYLEGNLDSNDLRDMNIFLDKNPDIKKELDEMQLFYLEPDEKIIFTDKDVLFKNVAKAEPKVVSLTFQKWVAGVAAILLISFFTFTILNRSDIVDAPQIVDENPVQLPKTIENKNEIIIEEKIEENIAVQEENLEKKVVSPPTITPESTPKNITPITYEKQSNTSIATIPQQPNNPKNNYDQDPLNYQHSVPVNSTPKNDVPQHNFVSVLPPPATDINDQPKAPVQPLVQPKEEQPVFASLPTLPAITLQSINEPTVNKLEDNVQVIAIVEKESRLSKWGLLPENRNAKMNLRSIKKAFTPESMASR